MSVPSLRRCRAALLAAALLAALLTLAPLAFAGADGAAPPAAREPTLNRLSFLRVAPGAGPAGLARIVDAGGRTVLLRGVNVNGLVDYPVPGPAGPAQVAYPTDPAAYADGRCPPRNPAVESMTVCGFDARQLRAFGYNSVRLALSWSLLEPRPGRIDRTYLARVAQVVGWLGAQGIYTVLDLHQDAWSKYLYTARPGSCPPPTSDVRGRREADGAPSWASVVVSPACQLRARELDPAVQEAFQRFWSDAPAPDGVGLQEHFAGVVAALARRFRDDPAVAGYDLLNEPSPGFVAPNVFDAAELFPFYAKVVAGVRSAVPGFRQLFFVEPDIARDITDERTVFAPWSAYSRYRNVVYSPHVYTRVFTPDAYLAGAAGTPTFLPLHRGYDTAAADARALGLPLWVGEFGNAVADDDTVLRDHYANADRLGIGSSLWVWKQDATGKDGADGFSVLHGPFGRGVAFPSRVRLTSRAYPWYVAGRLRALSYDPDTGRFSVAATSRRVRPGDRAGATVVFVPAAWSGRVVADGATVRLYADPAGNRVAYVYPRGGDYRLRSAAR